MSALSQFVAPAWLTAYVLASLAAAGHALLHKRDPRSAWGWIAVCWLFPLAGAILYVLFGINRIAIPHGGGDQPMSAGNSVTALFNGEQAYPAMLEAIANARFSVCLQTYIYRADWVGERFVQALALAQTRGVQVRVLVDGVSDVVYRPRASGLLERWQVRHALFLPLRWWPPFLHVNLRNHRKLLLVDGQVAFCGGMNIAEGHLAGRRAPNRVADMHCRVEGPVVAQLAEVFRCDWQFSTGEDMPATESPSALPATALCRAVVDGPDHHTDPLMLAMLAALAAARRRVRMITPYFLPPAALVSALEATALRGVNVEILIPERSNHRWVDRATRHALAPLIEHGVHVMTGAAPFDHTKLMLIDDQYLQFGSANLDVRSMRLNFELNIECYCARLAEELHRHFEVSVATAKTIRVADLDARALPVRLVDAGCWLFSPYF